MEAKAERDPRGMFMVCVTCLHYIIIICAVTCDCVVVPYAGTVQSSGIIISVIIAVLCFFLVVKQKGNTIPTMPKGYRSMATWQNLQLLAAAVTFHNTQVGLKWAGSAGGCGALWLDMAQLGLCLL